MCVGDLITLTDRRADREQREREIAMSRSRHPALRWVAGSAFYIAHRKTGSVAACGARGDLVLAPPGVPLCVECYPPPPRDETG